MQRFFVLRSAADYEAFRARVDAAREYPSDRAATAFDPVAICPRSPSNAPVLALSAALIDDNEDAIAETLASGAAVEIDQPAYEAATTRSL